MLKRLVASLMVLVLFFGTAGYFFVFKAEQMGIRHAIKEELKRSIPRSQLHEIVLSVDEQEELEWEEEGKEFRYEGRMYDVVSVSSKGGKTHYYCIGDDEETTLFAKLGKQVKQQQDTRQNSPAKTFAKVFFSLDYYPPHTLTLPYVSSIFIAHREKLKQLHSQEYLTYITPPPKLS